jgi:NAD(P)-dependent dehydrogenase (short-subunit alcohol dehydrogenase family)
MILKGQRVAIIGGTSGIGLAVARASIEAGQAYSRRLRVKSAAPQARGVRVAAL